MSETSALALLREIGPIFRAREAVDVGVSWRDLYELRDRGDLLVLSRGLYQLRDADCRICGPGSGRLSEGRWCSSTRWNTAPIRRGSRWKSLLPQSDLDGRVGVAELADAPA